MTEGEYSRDIWPQILNTLPTVCHEIRPLPTRPNWPDIQEKLISAPYGETGRQAGADEEIMLWVSLTGSLALTDKQSFRAWDRPTDLLDKLYILIDGSRS